VNEVINFLLLIAGFGACISLPLIALFDNIQWRFMHYVFAGFFFLFHSLYCFCVGQIMYYRIYQFPVKDHFVIVVSYWFSYISLGLMLLLLVSVAVFGTYYWVAPFIEWVVVIMYINYFCFINLTNPYFDSIEIQDEKPLLQQQQQQRDLNDL
jgi:Na+/alanine symporter